MACALSPERKALLIGAKVSDIIAGPDQMKVEYMKRRGQHGKIVIVRGS